MSIWERLQKLAFISFLAAIALSAFLYYEYKDVLSIQEFRSAMGAFGFWTPAIFIISYTIVTIFIPSTPFMALAGVLFGFKLGLAYTLLGGILSSLLVFLISRKLGKGWVETILQNRYLKRLDKYNRRLENGAILDLVLLRIAPVMPFNALNILMGISRISAKDYIVGTIIGLIPSHLIAVYFGTFITKIF